MELKTNQMVPLRSILKAILNNGTVQVVFEKVDGSIRVLNCTTNSAKITSVTGEEDDADGAKSTRKESTSVISVFEVDEEKWKSFKLDKLISINSVKVEEILKLIPKV